MRKREWRGRIGKGYSMEYDERKKPVLQVLKKQLRFYDESKNETPLVLKTR